MTQNININQGDTLNLQMSLLSGTQPFVLSGFRVTGQVKYYPSFTGLPIEMACSVLSEESGIININLLNTQTASIPIGQWPYDICVYSSTESYRPTNGLMIVSPSITTTPIIEESPPV